MDVEDLFGRMGGLQSMARELGIDPRQASSGAAALLPAVLGGLQRRGGQQDMGNLLNQLGGGSLLDNVQAPEPTNVRLGNIVLGEIFGTKEVSRTVAMHASSQSGLDPATLKKMLPMLAMMATGFLARQQGTQAAPAAAPQGQGGLGGLGGLGAMLDANSNGNPLDDILGMAGRMPR